MRYTKRDFAGRHTYINMKRAYEKKVFAKVSGPVRLTKKDLSRNTVYFSHIYKNLDTPPGILYDSVCSFLCLDCRSSREIPFPFTRHLAQYLASYYAANVQYYSLVHVPSYYAAHLPYSSLQFHFHTSGDHRFLFFGRSRNAQFLTNICDFHLLQL